MKNKTIIKLIFGLVEKRYDISEKAIRGKSRNTEVVYARFLTGALIYKFTKKSLNEVGKELKRNRATIYIYVKSCNTSTEYSNDYNKLVIDMKFYIKKYKEIKTKKLLNLKNQ